MPVAPLQPIPTVEEPFSRVIVDCMGTLPKAIAGNQYFTYSYVCKSINQVFTMVGLLRSIQSDKGTNFMSYLFQQIMYQLGIKQVKSSAYHPESQGALERFHQMLKYAVSTVWIKNTSGMREYIWSCLQPVNLYKKP